MSGIPATTYSPEGSPSRRHYASVFSSLRGHPSFVSIRSLARRTWVCCTPRPLAIPATMNTLNEAISASSFTLPKKTTLTYTQPSHDPAAIPDADSVRQARTINAVCSVPVRTAPPLSA
ncbi:hypothetical protein BS47DRAFT_1387827 [Hydnum rufescens UP504]|uniref:Uncharacterized protein n=1 Tax=Hydnum rufescens UP504 TaxID=1448309 RepID=A0A9P6B986_9AGAM|nr:hypothetical protein BS47DRAFT_1387827 [Hydnum rufescens UP504]